MSVARIYATHTRVCVCVCVAGLGQIEKNITKIKYGAREAAEKAKPMEGSMLKIESTTRAQLLVAFNDE